MNATVRHPLHLKVDLRVPLYNNVALAEAPPDRTLLFSHHEKVVVVDQRVAFCGEERSFLLVFLLSHLPLPSFVDSLHPSFQNSSYYIVLYYITLHCIVLYRIVSYHMSRRRSGLVPWSVGHSSAPTLPGGRERKTQPPQRAITSPLHDCHCHYDNGARHASAAIAAYAVEGPAGMLFRRGSVSLVLQHLSLSFSLSLSLSLSLSRQLTSLCVLLLVVVNLIFHATQRNATQRNATHTYTQPCTYTVP